MGPGMPLSIPNCSGSPIGVHRNQCCRVTFSSRKSHLARWRQWQVNWRTAINQDFHSCFPGFVSIRRERKIPGGVVVPFLGKVRNLFRSQNSTNIE
jgi:hypothetical protein